MPNPRDRAPRIGGALLAGARTAATGAATRARAARRRRASAGPLAASIAAGDLELFSGIGAQLTLADQASLLALHSALADVHGSFTYLEIGSHLGGSLQVLARDPRCREITSIDARPADQPDERGLRYAYLNNSTQRMLDGLAALPGADLSKVRTIDASTEYVTPEGLGVGPDVCFVDAEHTNDAVLRDARFCRRLLGDGGILAFHDGWIVHAGLQAFAAELDAQHVSYAARSLADSVFVFELGPPRVLTHPALRLRTEENWRGYMQSIAEARSAWGPS